MITLQIYYFAEMISESSVHFFLKNKIIPQKQLIKVMPFYFSLFSVNSLQTVRLKTSYCLPL